MAKDNITLSLKKMIKRIKSLPPEAAVVFKENTPIDKGYARAHTKLTGTTIHADYPYARRLDNGYSKQSPKGMTDPTVKFIKAQLKKIIRK